MNAMKMLRRLGVGLGAGVGVAAGAYGAYAGASYLRYGHAKPPRGKGRDPLLDSFMPVYEVAERHRIYVAAPADVTLTAATEVDLGSSPIVRGIFKARELCMGSAPGDRKRPHGLLEDVKSLGWVVLAEIPDREIVVGAVTRPWEADVVFRSVPAESFAAFNEPGYVKIAWTLRADPIGRGGSIARTETRVVSTDSQSREKFRGYWAFASPGIVLIRRLMMQRIKRHAERSARWHAVSTVERDLVSATR